MLVPSLTLQPAADGAARRAGCAPRRDGRPGSHRTRWCTTCRRAAWSSTRAAAGAPAMSVRDRWNCCWRWTDGAATRLLLRVMATAEPGRRLAAVVHVLRARARHPSRRLARRYRLLAAAGARAVSDCLGRCRRARGAGPFFDARARTRASTRRCGSTSQRALDTDRAAASSPAPPWRPTATATGTTRCSRPIRRCASICAAPGRSRCISRR